MPKIYLALVLIAGMCLVVFVIWAALRFDAEEKKKSIQIDPTLTARERKNAGTIIKIGNTIRNRLHDHLKSVNCTSISVLGVPASGYQSYPIEVLRPGSQGKWVWIYAISIYANEEGIVNVWADGKKAGLKYLIATSKDESVDALINGIIDGIDHYRMLYQLI